MDKFVRQKERVTDYRTRYSGIRPEDVTGSKAEPFAVVQKEAADFFKGRVLVGHAIQNDLKARLYIHLSSQSLCALKCVTVVGRGGSETIFGRLFHQARVFFETNALLLSPPRWRLPAHFKVMESMSFCQPIVGLGNAGTAAESSSEAHQGHRKISASDAAGTAWQET